MKTKRFALNAALAIVCLSMIVSPGFAQDSDGREWWSVTAVEVKPDKDTEFQDLLKNHWLPAIRKTDTQTSVWRTAQFGDVFRYVFASPMSGFAMYDGQPPLAKVLEKDEYAVLFSRLRECVNSVEGSAVVAREDLSFDKAPDEAPKMAVLNIAHVRPDKIDEYEALVKEVIPHVKRSKYRAVWTFLQVFGGDTNEFHHVVLMDKFGDLDAGPPLLQVLGPEKAKQYEDRFAELMYREELYLMTHLPEYSHIPSN